MAEAPLWLSNSEYYFKSQEEMKSIFRDLPEAIETISEIVDKIESYTLERNVLLPKFDIPKEFKTKMNTCGISRMKERRKNMERFHNPFVNDSILNWIPFKKRLSRILSHRSGLHFQSTRNRSVCWTRSRICSGFCCCLLYWYYKCRSDQIRSAV